MIGHARARKLAIDFVGNVGLRRADHRRVDVFCRYSTGCATSSTTWAWSPSNSTTRSNVASEASSVANTPGGWPPTDTWKRHAAVGGQPAPPLPPAGQFHGVAVGSLPQATATASAQLVQRTHPPAGGVAMARDHTYATLIVGAGFAGLGAAIRLAEAGLNKTGDHHSGARRPRGRNLARHHVSGCEVRHPLAALLVLVRQEPDLVANVLARRGDLPPPRGHGDQVRHPPAHPVRPRSQRLTFAENKGIWSATTQTASYFMHAPW